MPGTWTFGRRIAAGFALTSLLLVAVGLVGYSSIVSLIATGHAVTRTDHVLEQIGTVLSLQKDAETGQRGYLLTGDDSYLEPYNAASEQTPRALLELHDLTAGNSNQQHRLDQLEPMVAAKFAELKRTIDLRRAGHADDAVRRVSEGEGKRLMDEIRRIAGDMQRDERDLLRSRVEDAEANAAGARVEIIAGTVVCLLIAIFIGLALTRSLKQQVGSSVSQVRSSSAELQAVATQQASSAREQATAVAEIATTVSELVATSRQIAESAQRVAQIAEQTAAAARAGDATVDRGQESIGGIRRQMELVVGHMLDLGRKSQEIGSVLDVVSELAEQTNILAINATIEASGAGEGGRRFGAVADEIRKLADRVSSATKGIRSQIDQVRGAVNTTVMATEGGAKAVENGARHFGDVAGAFRQIASQVATTTDAAREIEVSTKQQATAAEQVRLAINEVAQATREGEASTAQTLQTASQLSGLSTELQRLIHPDGVA